MKMELKIKVMTLTKIPDYLFVVIYLHVLLHTYVKTHTYPYWYIQICV